MGPDCSTCQPEQGRTFMTEREGWEHECGTVQPGLSSSEVCECVVGGGTVQQRQSKSDMCDCGWGRGPECGTAKQELGSYIVKQCGVSRARVWHIPGVAVQTITRR
jgi:hypothetical protein